MLPYNDEENDIFNTHDSTDTLTGDSDYFQDTANSGREHMQVTRSPIAAHFYSFSIRLTILVAITLSKPVKISRSGGYTFISAFTVSTSMSLIIDFFYLLFNQLYYTRTLLDSIRDGRPLDEGRIYVSWGITFSTSLLWVTDPVFAAVLAFSDY